MCGEYSHKLPHIGMLPGSPPHVWRIRSQLLPHQGSYRITSTCVENTLKVWFPSALTGDPSTCVENTRWCGWRRMRCGDHLHMCGEYELHVRRGVVDWGSPPHVWRIHFPCYGIDRFSGITSTCVENTDIGPRPIDQHMDHLHMCGEYSKQIPL